MSPAIVKTVTAIDTAAASAVRKAAGRNKEGALHGTIPAAQMEELHALSLDLDGIITKVTGEKCPRVILSVDVNDRRQLGHYKLGRDGLGLAWRVSINAIHLGRSKADVFATVAHEKLHALQHSLGLGGKPPYHDNQFRDWSEKLGIPTDEQGHDKGIMAGSVFAQWCKEHGFAVKTAKPTKGQEAVNPTPVKGVGPAFVPPSALPKAKGSNMVRWSCGCTNVRVSGGVEFAATCDHCGNEFVEGKRAPTSRPVKAPKAGK